MAEKIKAVDPHIIVTEVISKAGSKVPYFQIRYYDLADEKWHLGYGSRMYSNVAGWLKEYFEEVKIDVRPERHGHWITRHEGLPFCSECNYNGLGYIAVDLDYCPHCGAKMDGKENPNE